MALKFLFWNDKYEKKFINRSWVVQVVNSITFERHEKMVRRYELLTLWRTEWGIESF